MRLRAVWTRKVAEGGNFLRRDCLKGGRGFELLLVPFIYLPRQVLPRQLVAYRAVQLALHSTSIPGHWSAHNP